MYHLVILLALLNSINCDRNWCRDNPEGCRWKHHGWNMNEHPDVFFRSFSGEVMSVDRRVQNFCNEYHVVTTEVYGTENYKMILVFQDYSEEDIQVKVQHKTIYVKAEKNTISGKAAVIRVIPSLVDTGRATWSFADGQLTVVFPYKVALGTSVVQSCDPGISDSTIDVPRS